MKRENRDMAWCYYCRCYTVNGRCPKCNRMYTEPNKNYDFYGKEIKSTSSKTSSNSSDEQLVSGNFARGFWLGIGICFFAIIIAKKHNRKLLKGAITGTIISGIFYLHVVSIILLIVFKMLGIEGI